MDASSGSKSMECEQGLVVKLEPDDTVDESHFPWVNSQNQETNHFYEDCSGFSQHDAAAETKRNSEHDRLCSHKGQELLDVNSFVKQEPPEDWHCKDAVPVQVFKNEHCEEGSKWDQELAGCQLTNKSLKCFKDIDDHNTADAESRFTQVQPLPTQSETCSESISPGDGAVTHKTTEAGPHVESETEITTKQKRYRCDECGRSLAKLSCLKKHKLTHQEQRPFPCDQCPKGFMDACNLTRHKLTHSGHRPFVCDVCNKSFREAGTLRKHQRVHTGAKPFVCGLCGKTFTQSGNLKKHLRAHSGNRPFVCEICSRAFAEKAQLKKHKEIHSKSFSCDVCTLTFDSAASLKEHRKTHVPQKPFQCDSCDASFSKLCNLQTHKWIHIDKPYQCDMCSQSFRLEETLTKHKAVIHANEKP